MDFGIEELFTRQIPVFKLEGQQKLKDSTILIIGVGGLGSTVSMVLARSGVGHLVIADFDTVSLSNIHRQLLYSPKDIGKNKVDVAAENPLLCLSKITPLVIHINKEVVFDLINKYKPICVMDCTDNFTVRIETNYACAKLKIPFIFGSVTAEQGQVSIFCNTLKNPKCPCFACIHKEKPQSLPNPPPVIPGICTIIGTLQAQQAISLITGVGDTLEKELLTFDMAKLRLRRFTMRDRLIDCPICNNEIF